MPSFAFLCTGVIKIFSISMEGKYLRVLVSVFQYGSSTSDNYKIIKDSYCSSDVDSNQNNHLSGSMLLMSQTVNSLEIARDTLIFLL